MSEDDLSFMQNKDEANVYLNKRLENMTLVPSRDSRGRRRIMEK